MRHQTAEFCLLQLTKTSNSQFSLDVLFPKLSLTKSCQVLFLSSKVP